MQLLRYSFLLRFFRALFLSAFFLIGATACQGELEAVSQQKNGGDEQLFADDEAESSDEPLAAPTRATQTDCERGKFGVNCMPCPAGISCLGGRSRNQQCVPGQYCPKGTSIPQVCPEGSYCESPAKEPNACPSGQYCPDGSAQPVACPAGAYCPAGSPEPIACDAGQYCPAGSSESSICASGFWDHDADQASPCVAQSTCLAGEFISSAGTAVVDRACSACTESFSNEENASACVPFSPESNCVTGIRVPGSSTADLECHEKVISVSSGNWHTCAVLASGALSCWGNNEYGQLGDGTEIDSSSPVMVSGLDGSSDELDVLSVSAGMDHTCAVLRSGALKCWGRNQYGQLGAGIENDEANSTPAFVTGFSNDSEDSRAVQIAAGGYHTCAVLVSGALECWGQNTKGQLGNESTTQSSSPVEVSGLDGVVSSVALVRLGFEFTCAQLESEAVKCWGSNVFAQLGNGSTNTSANSTPGFVSGFSEASEDAHAIDLSTGEYHACIVVENGAVECWGYNYFGQLGSGTDNVATGLTPAEVAGFSATTEEEQAVKLSAGTLHTCILSKSDALKCWGNNSRGQLGNGADNSGVNSTPSLVTGFSSGAEANKTLSLSTGEKHTCALLVSGALQCWGLNEYGQLGNDLNSGTRVANSTPLVVSWP